jgi:hypothetical protein
VRDDDERSAVTIDRSKLLQGDDRAPGHKPEAQLVKRTVTAGFGKWVKSYH